MKKKLAKTREAVACLILEADEMKRGIEGLKQFRQDLSSRCLAQDDAYATMALRIEERYDELVKLLDSNKIDFGVAVSKKELTKTLRPYDADLNQLGGLVASNHENMLAKYRECDQRIAHICAEFSKHLKDIHKRLAALEPKKPTKKGAKK